MSAETLPDLKPDTLEISAKVKPLFSRGAGNTAILSDDPAKVVMGDERYAVYKNLQEEERAIVAGTGHAFSMFGKSEMELDKSLDGLSLSTTLGHNDLSMRLDRSKSFPNPRDRDQTITRYGTLKVQLSSRSTADTGQLKIVRRHNHQQFASLVNK